jgi:siroheme synthase
MSLEIGLPELAYVSIWLVGAEDNSDLCHLSPLAIYALRTADAVIHDPGIPQPILDLVTPPRYREAAPTEPAIERAIKLAEDGWRVVHLVNGSTAERASECATRLAEHGIPLRIASNIGETVVGEAPIALLLVRQPVPIWGSEPGAMVMWIATAQSQAARIVQRERPLDFSMSGLAG